MIALRSFRCLSRVRLSARARERQLCVKMDADRSAWTRFWSWTTTPRPHWRENPTEACVAIAVFGVTGSTSVAFVRPALKATTGIEGTLKDGPWSYRIMSVAAVSPIYASLLVSFGTLAGRHLFFAAMAYKIFGRFLPRSALQRIGAAFRLCVPQGTSSFPR